MKVYQIWPCDDCNPHCEDSLQKALQAIEVWLQEGSVNFTVKIKVLEMTREEFDVLPEYEGP